MDLKTLNKINQRRAEKAAPGLKLPLVSRFISGRAIRRSCHLGKTSNNQEDAQGQGQEEDQGQGEDQEAKISKLPSETIIDLAEFERVEGVEIGTDWRVEETMIHRPGKRGSMIKTTDAPA